MRRAVGAAAVAAAGAGAAVLFVPVEDALVLDIYLLVAGALLLAALVGATVRAAASGPASAFELARASRPRTAGRPRELARLEDQVTLATKMAADVHFRVRPVLREIAAHRLATRHGVTLDRDREQARVLLGEEAWELVRPDREPPRDSLGPGIAAERLRAVVDALERL